MSSEQVGGLIAHRNRVVYSHHAHGQASDRNHTYDATYTVNEDCTGTYPWGAVFDLFIDPCGDRFAWVLTVPDQSDGLSGIEQRVTYERVGA